jgi:hypothetical protein
MKIEFFKIISLSLNLDQEHVFKFREYAQTISRINLPPEHHFQAENPQIVDFRFNTHTPIP